MKLLILALLSFTLWESSDAWFGFGRKKGHEHGHGRCSTTTEIAETVTEAEVAPLLPRVKLLPDPGACGLALQDKIYGGKRAAITDFPWMVQIGYTKPNNKTVFSCGGVLISDQYVLTASHCVNGAYIPVDYNLTTIRLGEWNTATENDCDDAIEGESICSPPHVDIPVSEKIPHENYEKDSAHQYHDIALIRLSKKVEISRFVRPICLPGTSGVREKDLTDEKLETSGWGKTEKGDSKSNYKLKVTLDGISLESCKTVYKQMEVDLNNGQMCAGGKEGKDSCTGDSGGPLMAYDEETDPLRPYYYLAGLVSFGPITCGLEGWPGVYTRVGEYYDWIQNNMKD